MLHWVPRYSVRRFRFTVPNGAFVAHLARLASPPPEGGNGWQGWASGMSNGGPQKDAPANRGCRGIGVGLLADGQLIQIVDVRTATFRFGYFQGCRLNFPCGNARGGHPRSPALARANDCLGQRG